MPTSGISGKILTIMFAQFLKLHSVLCNISRNQQCFRLCSPTRKWYLSLSFLFDRYSLTPGWLNKPDFAAMRRSINISFDNWHSFTVFITFRRRKTGQTPRSFSLMILSSRVWQTHIKNLYSTFTITFHWISQVRCNLGQSYHRLGMVKEKMSGKFVMIYGNP